MKPWFFRRPRALPEVAKRNIQSIRERFQTFMLDTGLGMRIRSQLLERIERHRFVTRPIRIVPDSAQRAGDHNT